MASAARFADTNNRISASPIRLHRPRLEPNPGATAAGPQVKTAVQLTGESDPPQSSSPLVDRSTARTFSENVYGNELHFTQSVIIANMDAPRYLCSQLVTMSWDDGATTANLEEIQAGGCVIESEIGIAVGDELEIRCGTVFFAGQVTKAEEHAFGWRISVTFSPLTPWRIEQFRPEHLFDPAAMVRTAGGAETT
jgi:hypothetical protein